VSTKDAPERGAAGRIEGAPPRILVIQAPYYDQVVGGMRAAAPSA
jgi:6,7-dimethyl-8-ribityllumazine synthase